MKILLSTTMILGFVVSMGLDQLSAVQPTLPLTQQGQLIQVRHSAHRHHGNGTGHKHTHRRPGVHHHGAHPHTHKHHSVHHHGTHHHTHKHHSVHPHTHKHHRHHR